MTVEELESYIGTSHTTIASYNDELNKEMSRNKRRSRLGLGIANLPNDNLECVDKL